MDKAIEKLNKLSLPIVILIASIILGGFFYAIQVNKQRSIERQQEIKLQDERTEEVFNNNLKCQTLLKDLKQRWNNLIGIYYSEQQNTCIVKYTTRDEETKEAPIESMISVKPPKSPTISPKLKSIFDKIIPPSIHIEKK